VACSARDIAGAARTLASEPETLVEMLQRNLEQRPDAVAYIFLEDGETDESRVTYRELDRRARAVGAALQACVPEQARVLLLYPPGLDYAAAFFGALYAGAIAVPTYPPDPARARQTLPRFRAVADDSRPAAVLTTAPLMAAARMLFEESPALGALPWLMTDDLRPGLEAEWRPPSIHGHALAIVQYTSGSTGTPKGVLLSHDNVLYNQRIIRHAFQHSKRSALLGWLPLYHDMGLIGTVLQPAYCGFLCVLMSPLHFLQKPLRWLRAITRYRITTSGGPNFGYELCLRRVRAEDKEGLDLSSWDVAYSGAEPVRMETIRRFTAEFASCGFRREAFYPCYGLAEASLIVAAGDKGSGPIFGAPPFLPAASSPGQGPERVSAEHLVACGRTLPGQSVLIVDPESRVRRGEGEEGEIWVEGPSVARGYWNREEETTEIFRARLDGDDRSYLRTGDLGFLWKGELYITGRRKDLIIIRGANYYPQDLEPTVERSGAPMLRPGCGAAFAVDVGGEERLVVVQEIDRRRFAESLAPAASSSRALDALLGTIRRAIAELHGLQPYAILLIEPNTIPKTSSGKVRRHACRARFLEQSFSVVASWFDSSRPGGS